MDVINRVETHPMPGETLHGLSSDYSCGGKGANQAVAAALSGAAVCMIGAVGDDVFGVELKDTLQSFGVDVERVVTKTGTSGTAFITVDAHGENTIILSDGANGQLTVDDVNGALQDVGDIDAILVQNEVPFNTTLHAIQWAYQRQVRVIFNPAPAMPLPASVLGMIDCLIVNELEAQAITGVTVADRDGAESAGQQLVRAGVQSVIVTLGEQGSLYMDADQTLAIAAFQVNAVDTTAAGDTFIGAFAAASRSSGNIAEALQYAAAAAGLAVSRRGAQRSIPTREEVVGLLANRVTSGLIKPFG